MASSEKITDVLEKLFNEDRDTSLTGKPLKTAVISLLITGLMYSAHSLVKYPNQSPLTALSAILTVPLSGIILTGVLAVMTHLIGTFFDFQQEFSSTFAAYSYSTVLVPFAFLALLIPVYGPYLAALTLTIELYLVIKGVEILQEVSFLKASVSVLTPVIMFTVLALVIFYSLVLLVAAMFGLMGQNVTHGAGI